jgi:tRNA threonylcarbamoyl adenosine modification protein (Sua5/YciO/YrdC/YwlC family)
MILCIAIKVTGSGEYFCEVLRWEVLPSVPARRVIRQAQALLKAGGVLLYPTDTTYAMGVFLSHRQAFEKLCRIRRVSPQKNLFSVFLPSVNAIGAYAAGVDTPTYRLLKQLWPGLYTVILRAGPEVPRHLWHRQTIGFRVTTHAIVSALLEAAEEPIVTASVPQTLLASYERQVDGFLDAGWLEERQTTLIDLSGGLGQLKVLRLGGGTIKILEPWLMDKIEEDTDSL